MASVSLWRSNANDNTVTVLDTPALGRATDTLWATLYPNSPRGSTPNSLALSPDEKTLFVANANINAVAVFDVSSVGHGRSLGFIPTGWYPTSVRVTPDGRRLLVVNGKGNKAMADPDGPQPLPGLRRRGGRQYTVLHVQGHFEHRGSSVALRFCAANVRVDFRRVENALRLRPDAPP